MADAGNACDPSLEPSYGICARMGKLESGWSVYALQAARGDRSPGDRHAL